VPNQIKELSFGAGIGESCQCFAGGGILHADVYADLAIEIQIRTQHDDVGAKSALHLAERFRIKVIEAGQLQV
jgi:hypothetical protein